MEIEDFFGKEGIRVKCNKCKEMVFKEYGSWFLKKKTKRTEEKIFVCYDCQKKKEIIHAGIDNGSIKMYACNSYCGFHSNKIDFTWTKVTCKRCLNLLKKYDRSEKDGCIMFKDKGSVNQ